MAELESANAIGPEARSRSTAPDRSPLEVDAGRSKARRITFRILAIVTSLWVLALSVFGLTEVVLMWLPADTLTALLGEDAGIDQLEAHRAHFMSIGIAAWALVLAVVVQIRRPQRHQAAMVWAVAIVVTGAVVFALSGTAGQWLLEEGMVLVLVLMLAAQHPKARDLRRRPDVDRSMAGLAVVAAVPWMVFALSNAQRQWRDVPGDIHAEPEHWAIAALMALTIVSAGLIGSTDFRGWRLPAWFAVVASLAYGVHSLVFPSAVSALSTAWALGAISWGIAFAGGTIRRSRLASSAR